MSFDDLFQKDRQAAQVRTQTCDFQSARCPRTGGPLRPGLGLRRDVEWGCLRELQVTLSAAKISARVGAEHENACGICLCITRPQDQGTWGLAREDAPGSRGRARAG